MKHEDSEFDEATVQEAQRQLERIRRGAVQIVSEHELLHRISKSLVEARPLRVKLGVDPTAHDLHLGFTLPLSKLQIFSELGHQPVLIIGDATAMVGDPTGRNKARPRLTRAMVDDFAQSYLDQASRVLDMERVEVRRNSEWLESLGFMGTVQLAAKATVARMLERDDFSKRYAEGTPIYIHEFIYPLMQGYDSVVVQSDVELGGQDQLFNLLVGRDLQSDAGMAPQCCVMGPLLVGLDGSRKMSKSYDNYIGVTDDPVDMFGKVMSLPDEVMRDWFELVTDLPLDEVADLFAKGLHPRLLKERLGRTIVERFHDDEAAELGASEFARVFSRRELPSEMSDFLVPETEFEDGRIRLVRLVVAAGFAPSNKEAGRLIEQGGVSLDGEAHTDKSATVMIDGGEILRVGKKRFARLTRAH
ncbi:MAG: tyrosine--tRNA ligase [Planctomycetes bacterium]|nr:tyrosine--tRNA ligase [Planctomycetota bacterium]